MIEVPIGDIIGGIAEDVNRVEAGHKIHPTLVDKAHVSRGPECIFAP